MMVVEVVALTTALISIWASTTTGNIPQYAQGKAQHIQYECAPKGVLAIPIYHPQEERES